MIGRPVSGATVNLGLHRHASVVCKFPRDYQVDLVYSSIPLTD